MMMKKKTLFRCVIVAIALMTNLSAWAHDGDHTYSNGICTIEGCTDKYQAPELVDGWYLVENAGNVEWIGDYVQNVAINPNVKMTADIDFTGVSHTMIGRNDGRKFNGVWDGQGHRIKNLTLNYGSADTPNAVGFFAWVRGGSTIKNLIMDKSCYFEGKVRVAAFVGVTQVAGAGAVRIENCVNEAKVQGHTGATGAFIGCRNPNNTDTPQAVISGCANHGDILCDANEAGAFVGWANGNGHIVENSYNTGKISVDGNKRGFIRADGFTVTNSYDFGSSSNGNTNSQSTNYEWATSDPVASGELAFVINDKAGSQIFYQNLAADIDACPVPFSTSAQVYSHGNYRCDGVALPGTTYDNTYSEGAVIPPHSYSDNGICQNEGCTAPALRQEPEVDADGWSLIATVANVEWLSDKVASSGGAYVAKAKLVADIDFENKVNIHAPIGPATSAKFKGEFDGQGHRIKNMIIDQPTKEAQGFFGWLQGNSPVTIKNLIIDSSCSVTAMNKAGGLAGASQNEGSLITIENVVTGASVTVSGQDAAGIVGGELDNKATYYVHNVVNTGIITSTHQYPYAGALFCYQERGTVQNFINLGTINGHKGGNMGRFRGTWKNVVDLSNTDQSGTNDDETNHGFIDELTAEDIVSGKLAFYMNEKAEDDSDVFFQTLGEDEYPLPLNTSLKVYGEAWDGTNTVYYNNEEGAVTASKVVIDDQCSAFALPEETTSATAQSVAYSRTNVAGLNTVCLPFALTADLLPAEAKIYTLGDIKEASIDVSEVTEVAAGEPCLVEFPADYSATWDIAIDATTALATAPANTGAMKGSYTTENIGAGKYKLNSAGTAFGQTTDAATVKPFRAYVEAASAAKTLILNFGGETGIEAIGNLQLSIDNPTAVYDPQGRQTTLRKGINIVKMSNGETRKVVVK